jgi:GTP-binding protein EngB required for normal cell division
MPPVELPVSTVQSRFLEILGPVREAASRFRLVSLERPLEVCEGLAAKSPLIDVAILGQFKAGKSSFLNALIGRLLLPVGVIPVTTVITRIAYGPKERAVVSCFDGTWMEIGLESLEEYTSEAKNPGNERNVSVVDIELPSLEGYAGLRLVDTPGLGSVFRYHMETSENWLPEVGAALLAISADRPLSEHDLALIRELVRYTPRILLLLTKADLLLPAQQDEVVRFFQDTLKRELNRDFPIYLFSTRTDTERFQYRLETELLNPLAQNRDAEFGRILNYKVQSLARNCRSYLDIALRTSLRADEDRRILREQILGEKANITEINEELMIMTRETCRHTRVNIDKYLNRFKKPLREKLAVTLAKDMAAWRGNLWKLSRRYEEWLREVLTEELEEISQREHRHFYGTLLKAQSTLDRYLQSFRAVLEGNIERILGVRMASTDWNIEVEEPSRPDIQVGHTFQFHFDLLWFLFPMALFRGVFERHFLAQIPHQVEVNFSRLSNSWEERINRTIEEMRRQASRCIREEIDTIEGVLSRTEGQTETIRRLIAALQKERGSIPSAGTQCSEQS